MDITTHFNNILGQIRTHARIHKVFFRFGPNFDNVFFLDEESQILSSARQRHAISMASPWRANDGPTLDAGLVAL